MPEVIQKIHLSEKLFAEAENGKIRLTIPYTKGEEPQSISLSLAELGRLNNYAEQVWDLKS